MSERSACKPRSTARKTLQRTPDGSCALVAFSQSFAWLYKLDPGGTHRVVLMWRHTTGSGDSIVVAVHLLYDKAWDARGHASVSRIGLMLESMFGSIMFSSMQQIPAALFDRDPEAVRTDLILIASPGWSGGRFGKSVTRSLHVDIRCLHHASVSSCSLKPGN